MTAVLALALLARQASADAPTLPVGTSVEFAKAALAVEARLVDGDFPGARAAARALPVRAPRIAWADEGLLRPELVESRKQGYLAVLARWQRVSPSFSPTVSTESPDLTIGFANVLPDGPDGLPLATRVEPGSPFRATIGLTRGKPGVPLRPQELNVEIAYALGRYLGVAESKEAGTAMHRDARPGIGTYMPLPYEQGVAARNLDLSDRLRAAVEAKKPLGLTVPTVRLVTAALDLGEVRQGRSIRAAIEVENLGSGPLDYNVRPDCNCFSPVPPGRVAALGRKRVALAIDTHEYMGRQEKSVLFLSNDPTQPQIEVPVTFRVRPAYRLFHPGGESVTVPDAGGAYDFFLFTDPEDPINPISFRWEGFDAKVTSAPWSGTLADPDMQEGPLPRKGWRYRVRVSPKLAPGRYPGTLVVETDSASFRELPASLYAYKGIVVDPESVALGDIGKGTTASFLVSRPGVPFKVTGVSAGPFKASWKVQRNGSEYRIDLEYRGGAVPGDLLLPIRVRTDDPKQPVVEALAHGNVR